MRKTACSVCVLIIAAILSGLVCFSGCGSRGETSGMWFEHSTKKVLRDTLPGENKKAYTLFLARNEYEGCHLALNFPVYHENVTARVTGIEYLSGEKPENAGNVTAQIFREHYLSVTMSSPFLSVSPENDGRYAEYPDALYLSDEPFALPGNTTEPLYILIHSDKDCLPGEYSVEIGVFDGEMQLDSAVLTVHVWDFELDDAPAMAAVSELSRDSVARAEGVSGDDLQRLYEEYYDFLVEHHISPYSLPYDVLDERADRFMNDPRVTGFRVSYGDDDYLRAAGEKLRSNPEWMKKAYFYFLDEPSDEGSYMTLVNRCSHLKEIIPEARIVSPFFVDPDMFSGEDAVEYCFGSVNIWCAKLHCFDSANIYSESQMKRLAPLSERLSERRALGEDVWTYVCWEPGEPYLNLYVNMEGIRHRLIFWQNYMLGANGFLYWSSNYWTRVGNPWNDAATVNWLSPFVYGDGSLLYNGSEKDECGPCSSIRLELVRDGIDDYAYMTMLEKLGVSRNEIIRMVKHVTSSLTEYTSDDSLLYNIRISFGNLIEKLLASQN